MNPTFYKFLGTLTAVMCSSVLILTPWPTAEELFHTHASPSLHESR